MRLHRLLAVTAAAALVLVGCSSQDSAGSGKSGTAAVQATLAKVSVTGEPGRKPTVKFDKPITFDAMAFRLVNKGSGTALEAGQRLTLNETVFDGSTGKMLQSSYDTKQTSQLALTAKGDNAQVQQLFDVLKGAKVGARVLVGYPAQQSNGATGASPTPGPSYVDVLDVVSAKTVPTQASGKAVAPPAGLPTVQVDGKDKPTGITIPAGQQPPADLVSQLLVEGSGAAVKDTDNVTVQYTGVNWRTGKVFDSSWSRGTPADFQLNQVVKGWTQGLSGKKVGSRVLLVVPPDLGYGPQGGNAQAGIEKTDTLVFVVDILDAQPAQQ